MYRSNLDIDKENLKRFLNLDFHDEIKINPNTFYIINQKHKKLVKLKKENSKNIINDKFLKSNSRG